MVEDMRQNNGRQRDECRRDGRAERDEGAHVRSVGKVKLWFQLAYRMVYSTRAFYLGNCGHYEIHGAEGYDGRGRPDKAFGAIGVEVVGPEWKPPWVGCVLRIEDGQCVRCGA